MRSHFPNPNCITNIIERRSGSWKLLPTLVLFLVELHTNNDCFLCFIMKKVNGDEYNFAQDPKIFEK